MPGYQLDITGADQVWRRLSPVTRGFIEAMFWAGLDERYMDVRCAEQPDDTKGLRHLDYAALCTTMEECKRFEEQAAPILPQLYRMNGEQVGHDFYLTRLHHGAGFWDGDWPEPQADSLTKLARSFPEFDLYVGDDGKVYRSDV